MTKIFKSIDLFAGIGGIRIAFENYGVQNVFSSEWDKYACDMYENYFGDRPHGDITLIDEKNIPEHDILLAGFPCQAFSIMGDKTDSLQNISLKTLNSLMRQPQR